MLKAIGPDVVMAMATGCMEIISSPYPLTSWNIPWIHVAFENAAAVASGVESGLKVLRRKGRIPDRDVTVLAMGGDGATADIGFQALSGMMERGHKVIYVCVDNEAYMNTGVQRFFFNPVWGLHYHVSSGKGHAIRPDHLEERYDSHCSGPRHTIHGDGLPQLLYGFDEEGSKS